MADIERRRTIVASPEAIWDVLADFGAISTWAANIDHSCILVHGAEPTRQASQALGGQPDR